MLDESYALDATGAIAQMVRTAMAVTVGNMMDVREERSEVGPMRGAACRERERTHSATVEGAQKGNHVLAFRRVAGELDGRLDRFGARVGEKDLLLGGSGSQTAELLHQIRHGLIVKIAPAKMEKLPRLLLDGRHDLGMRMAGGGYRDPGGEIEKEVAIDILDDHSLALLDNQRINPPVRRSAVFFVALNDFSRLRARRLDLNVGNLHPAILNFKF